MKLQFYLKDTNATIVNVYVRISDSKRYDLKIKTPISIFSDCFKNGEIKIPKIASQNKIQDCKQKQTQLHELNAYLFTKLAERSMLTTKEAKELINSFFLGPDQVQTDKKIIDLYDDYLSDRVVAFGTYKRLCVLKNHIKRFEQENEIALTLTNFTNETVVQILDSVKNGNRGFNTCVNYHKAMRTFCSWLQEKQYTQKNFYKGIEIPVERYGTPYYLTTEEREQFSNADLPQKIAIQRDIFIFQTYIGCRVSDLLQLTKNNINGDFLEYIADKTLNKPKLIRVPLAAKAKELIAKYEDPGKERLFPFISAQKYNEDIKAAAKMAGLNRQIQILDSRTGKKIFKPLHEIISSHCARRTFVGLLYKKTKDVNVIASMSGHAENSRAFSRYRAIDDDDKKELIDLL